MMSLQKYQIPQMQPLPPSLLVRRSNDVSRYFPFSHDNAQYYYLARNGLWYGLSLLDLKPGDIVLMPSYHHGVEVEALLRKGLKPIYYRIDEKMQIDFGHLESIVTERAKALYVIHYIGFPQPNKLLSKFAKQHGLKYIEDCALSLFSSAPEGELGTFGDISIFCLYKTLPVPHGGMLVVNDPSLTAPSQPHRPNFTSTVSYLSHRLLDNLGTHWEGTGYKVNRIIKGAAKKLKRGIRVEQVQVDSDLFQEKYLPLGISRVTRHIISGIDVESVVRYRRGNYLSMLDLLKGVVGIPFPELPSLACPLFFPILVDDKLSVHKELNRRGVESVYFWSRTHPDVRAEEFPEVNFLRKHILELPIHQGLNGRHIEYIAEVVKEVV